MVQFLVADGRGGRQNSAEEDELARAVGEKLVLEAIPVDEPLGCAACPVVAEVLEVLPRKFLEDEPADDHEARTAVNDVGIAHVARRRAVREARIERFALAGPEDLQVHLVADEVMHIEQMRDGDFSVRGVVEVAVLIDREVIHTEEHVALLQAGLCGGAVLEHFGDVNATGDIVGDFRVAAQSRITGGAECVADARKARVMAARDVLQEMLDDRSGDDVRVRGLRVVAHQDSGELAAFHDGQCEAVIAALDLHGRAVDEESAVHWICGHFRGGHRACRHEEASVVFELPHAELIADAALGDLQAGCAGEQIVVGSGLQQREICLVVHGLEGRGNLASALGIFEFEIREICNEVGRHEHAIPRQDSADRTPRERLPLAPRTVEIPRLGGDVDADDAQLFRSGGDAGCDECKYDEECGAVHGKAGAKVHVQRASFVASSPRNCSVSTL